MPRCGWVRQRRRLWPPGECGCRRAVDASDGGGGGGRGACAARARCWLRASRCSREESDFGMLRVYRFWSGSVVRQKACFVRGRFLVGWRWRGGKARLIK